MIKHVSNVLSQPFFLQTVVVFDGELNGFDHAVGSFGRSGNDVNAVQCLLVVDQLLNEFGTFRCQQAADGIRFLIITDRDRCDFLRAVVKADMRFNFSCAGRD